MIDKLKNTYFLAKKQSPLEVVGVNDVDAWVDAEFVAVYRVVLIELTVTVDV